MGLSYLKAWRLLENITPIDTDCGILCSQACCKGSHEDGMLLFPHEELMYKKTQDWFYIQNSSIRLSGGYTVKLFVCKGQCKRNLRPLSCRIFPVIPYIDDLDYLEFVPDLRGAMTCPLLNQTTHQISPTFIDTLFSAFETIIDDEQVLEFINILSKQNDELAKDYERLL